MEPIVWFLLSVLALLALTVSGCCRETTYVNYQPQEDYCRSNSCGESHIACGNTGDFAPHCSDDLYLVDITPYKENILYQHNKIRDETAKGTKKLKPAVKMVQMQWCDELSHLAELYLKACDEERPICHSTTSAPASGFNKLNYNYDSADSSSIENGKLIEKGIDAWVACEEEIDMNVILAYPENFNCRTTTLLMWDDNSHVGCAASRLQQGTHLEFQLICLYAKNNLISKVIYRIGNTSASECKNGVSKTYWNLCAP